MRIARKIALLTLVPLVSATAFAGLALSSSLAEATRADRLRLLVAGSASGGELAHRLQAERAAASVLLAGGPGGGASDRFLQQIAATERAIVDYQAARARLDAPAAGVQRLLERIDGQLALLAGMRQQVLTSPSALSAVAFSYRIVIADVLSFREATAAGAPPDVADQLRAAAMLSQAAEAVAQQQVAVLRAVDAGVLTPAGYQEVTATRTAYAEAVLAFEALAPPQWQSRLRRASTGGDGLAAQRLEEQVARVRPGDRLALDGAAWDEVMGARVDRLHLVEVAADGDSLEAVSKLRDVARLRAGAQAAAVLLVAAIALALAVWLIRSTSGRLRQLRDRARDVAYQRLPAIVDRLRTPAGLGASTPSQLADREAGASKAVAGRDEIAEVQGAFREVHRSAVTIAAQQALMRARSAETFVALARRGQVLANQLTKELDAAEREEQDPQQLEMLFRLDLLVARLGVANDSLLVLGGSAPAHAHPPTSLTDVVRAAQSRIAAYQRVELGVIDDGVQVVGEAVDGVMHLLVHLLDNATGYSHAPVIVHARMLSDRTVIQIVDEGIGIDPPALQALNERLATQGSEDDLTDLRRMGLTVVARIAASHRIRVELKPGQRRGTISEVTLPSRLLRTESPATDDPPRPALTARHAEQLSVAATPATQPPATWPPSSAGAAADASPIPRPRQPDDTLELDTPIFREVNGWFHTQGHDPDDAHAGWSGAADAGWRAAARTTEPTATVTTPSGLPKRAPMKNLVPGGVEQAAPPSRQRPDRERLVAVAAAFAAGVQRSRRPASIT